MRLGFGAEYTAGADALPLLGLAMTTLALTYLAVNFLLAVGRRRSCPARDRGDRRAGAAAAGSLDGLASFAAVVLGVQAAAAVAVLVPRCAGARCPSPPGA